MARSLNRNAMKHRHDDASCLSAIRHSPMGATGSASASSMCPFTSVVRPSSLDIRHSPAGATAGLSSRAAGATVNPVGATGSASAGHTLSWCPLIRHSSFDIRHSPFVSFVPSWFSQGSKHDSNHDDTKGTTRDERRGVLLLVVLGLLTIFTLLAVTFVIVARQSAIASREQIKAEQREDPPQVLLNSALMQVLRGTDDRRSVIGPHSISEDMYGSDGETFFVQPSIDPTFAGGQFLTFNLSESRINGQSTPTLRLEEDIEDYYNGRVATFLDGPAAGQSTRIVGYDASPNFRLRVMALENGAVPGAGDRGVDQRPAIQRDGVLGMIRRRLRAGRRCWTKKSRSIRSTRQVSRAKSR